MRSILSALVLLASSVAFAYPAVNDLAKFNGDVTMADGKKYPMAYEMKLTQYNSSTKQYLQVNTQSVGGQTEVEQAWMNEGDLMSKAQVQEIVAKCTQYGGRFEDVVTPVGTMKTCAILQENEKSEVTYWIGDIPFGIVKTQILDKTDKYTINLTIESFTAGTL